MSSLLVSNSSPLIILEKIGHLTLLRDCFGQIMITPEVRRETGFEIPWIQVQAVRDAARLRECLPLADLGEASTVILAMEIPGAIALVDDLHGRRLARALGVPHFGTVRILLEAKKQGILAEVRPVLETMRAKSYHLSPALIEEAARQAGE